MLTDLGTIRKDCSLLLAELQQAGAVVRKPNAICCPFHDDEHPSSGVYHESDGVWRFKCHGCGFGGDILDVRAKVRGVPVEDIIREVGESMPPTPKRIHTLEGLRSLPGLRWEATFEYTDPDTGRIDYISVRFRGDNGKDIRMAGPAGDGFAWGAPPKPWPIYNRGRVRGASQVVIVEGEPCVHALHGVGIVATTSPGGAEKAHHAVWSLLAGKKVYLWPDCDEPGRRHMEQVEGILRGLDPKPSIYWIEPNDLELAEHDDAVDYLKAYSQETLANRKLVIDAVLQDAYPRGGAADWETEMQAIKDGQRRNLPWPWPQLTRLAQALIPGTVTVWCGDPGSSKSFAMYQTVLSLAGKAKLALWPLEDNKAFHLRRMLAQRARDSHVLDNEWVEQNPEAIDAIWAEHSEFFHGFGDCITPAPPTEVRYDALLKWIDEKTTAGCELLIIDPVTAVSSPKDVWIEDLKFIMRAKAIVAARNSRLILVTHPRDGKGASSMDRLAGGRAYSRFTHNVIWLESYPEPKSVTVMLPPGPSSVECNRALHICKARSGPGAGMRIGGHWDGPTLSIIEHGLIRPQKG